MKQLVFNDFYEFSGAVKDVDCRMMIQHNTSKHVWSINRVTINNIDIQYGQLSSGNFLEGQARSDGFLFYLPLSENIEYIANGELISKGSVMILEPEGEFTLTTLVDHDWCSIFIPTTLFSNSLDNSELFIEKNTKKRVYVTRSSQKLANQFKLIVKKIMREATTNKLLFELSPVANSFSKELLRLCANLLNLNDAEEYKFIAKGRNKLPRDTIIQQCQKFIQSSNNSLARVSDLALVSKVSERTIRNVFNEFYGIGPKQYLERRQLNVIRNELQIASIGKTTVKNILEKNGIFEHGHFGVKYRSFFNEHPLETLEKK